MAGHRPRAAALAAGISLLLGATAAFAPTVSADPAARTALVDTTRGSAGYCKDGTGVTVVIDFQDLGGPSLVRCAPGDQATGLTALKNAGIRITGTTRWGEAFVCRIDGLPGPESEPCIDTPPATAYWSYWHAGDGGPWTYSQWGVTNRKPPPGSFEGWSFARNQSEDTRTAPRIAPLRPAADGSSGGSGAGTTGGGGTGGPAGGSGTSGGGQTTSGGGAGAPATGPTTAGRPDGSAGHGGTAANPGPQTGPDQPSEPATETPRDHTADPSPTASEGPLPGTAAEPTPAAGWTGRRDGPPPAAAAPDGGIPVGTVAGAAAAALVAAAAGATAWRRRRAARADRSA
ncbi:hypothetical protein [Streptomyces celluloflavus]|uniref:hypothetical protein n=1 Tax=Streptomyces celluloflavus TaxID=58344 RepID=UPI0036C06C00